MSQHEMTNNGYSITGQDIPRVDSFISEQTKIENAKGIIAGMNEDEFISFQHELQFALTYNQIALGRIGMIFLIGDIPVDEFSRLFELKKRHADYKQAIADSELYTAARERIQTRFNQEVDPNWTGWIGYDSIARENIIEAVKDIVNGAEGYQFFGTIIFSEQKLKIQERTIIAEKIIKSHGIEETFVAFGHNLTDMFLSRWGQNKTPNL